MKPLPRIPLHPRIDRQNHNLRRDAKTDRHDAGADPTRHIHVMIVFEDMTPRVFRAEAGRNNRSADQRKIHLSAVRVRGQQERNTAREIGKDVRIVGQRNDGRAGRDFSDGVRDVLRARP